MQTNLRSKGLDKRVGGPKFGPGNEERVVELAVEPTRAQNLGCDGVSEAVGPMEAVAAVREMVGGMDLRSGRMGGEQGGARATPKSLVSDAETGDLGQVVGENGVGGPIPVKIDQIF